MAYQTTAALPRSTLAWFNRAGRRLNPSGTLHDVEEPSLSTGRHASGSDPVDGGIRDIWLVDHVPRQHTSDVRSVGRTHAHLVARRKHHRLRLQS